jgi:hypothetical protein
LLAAAKLNRHLKVINLDGRYGKQAAITAGMDAADKAGAAVILADIDILNPVGVLGQIIERLDKGAKMVYARRENFGFDRVKAAGSDICVKIGAKLFGVDGFYTGKANIAAYSRPVADVILALPERNKFLRTMDNWVGWGIDYMGYASGYNKTEERNILAAAKKTAEQTPMVRGRKPLERDKVREHTSSIDFTWGFLAAALTTFVMGIVLAAVENAEAWAHLIVWLSFVLLLCLAFMYYTRAVLIKRVGVIHSVRMAHVYTIKNIIN